jgi:hypothetical protein
LKIPGEAMNNSRVILITKKKTAVTKIIQSYFLPSDPINQSIAKIREIRTKSTHPRLSLVKLLQMKKLFFSAFVFMALASNAQDIKPAEKGVVYGAALSATGEPVSINDLKGKLTNDQYEGKVTGKVKEVCKAEGCWIKLERKDGSTVMVRAKDHSFVMPTSIEGKTVVVEGTASVKEVTEEMRKHYAEDAGKSKKEIAKIKGSEKDVQLAAKSVMVID